MLIFFILYIYTFVDARYSVLLLFVI